MSKELIKKQIKEMFQIQDGLNKKVLGDDYQKLDTPFYRAAVVEAAELMEYRGYKWWKKTDSFDKDQAFLEIVDIWHFVMSQIISDNGMSVQDEVIEVFFDVMDDPFIKTDKETQLMACDSFIQCMFSGYIGDQIAGFLDLMESFDMPFDKLYSMYIGKNALNFFRQDNGYKEGTYNKNQWRDKNFNYCEDNVALAEILEYSDDLTFDGLYEALKQRYAHAQVSVGD